MYPQCYDRHKGTPIVTTHTVLLVTHEAFSLANNGDFGRLDSGKAVNHWRQS